MHFHRKKIKRISRVAFRRSWQVAAGLFVFSLLLMIGLRWVAPPTSAFMLRQRLDKSPVDYRWVPLEQISPHAALAVIAAEDQLFFDHWGVDFNAIAHAIRDNRTRKRPRGASTISQQVVKNLFLWPGRSYLRKGIEVYLTLLMEGVWSKKRILEVYLNVAEMGPGVFGVEAAAQRFFQKPAARLSQYEAAALAAVLPSPRRMFADRPSHYVASRTWQILEQMNMLGSVAALSGR